MNRKTIKNEKGFSAILLVVIIGAVALVMVKSLSFSSLNGLESATLIDKSGKAKEFAEACTENALYRLSLDSDYRSGEETIPLGDGYCRYSVTEGSDGIEISSIGYFEDCYKYLYVRVNADNGVVIEQYREVESN